LCLKALWEKVPVEVEHSNYLDRLLTKSAMIGRVGAGIAMFWSCMLLQQYVSTCSPIEVGKRDWSRDKPRVADPIQDVRQLDRG
jgi:hypothetical protein